MNISVHDPTTWLLLALGLAGVIGWYAKHQKHLGERILQEGRLRPRVMQDEEEHHVT